MPYLLYALIPHLPLQPTQLSPSQIHFYTDNIKRFKKEVYHLNLKILHHRIILQKDSWNKAINKLTVTNINPAPREFYFTMKQLGRLGKSSSHVTKMTYGQTTATSETEAPYGSVCTFQPLNKPDFDYLVFDCIQQEWNSAQDTLNNSTLPTISTHLHLDHTYSHFNAPQPSPMLYNTSFAETTLTKDPPNTTKL